MLSKLFTRLNQTQSATQMAQRAFRASPQMNKKPSIGDAVTILQSKVSNINQVVSAHVPNKKERSTKFKQRSYLKPRSLSNLNLDLPYLIIERSQGVRYCDFNW